MTLHTTWKPGDTGHAAEHNEISTRLMSAKDKGSDPSTALQSLFPNATLSAGVVVYSQGMTAGQYLNLNGAGREATTLQGSADLIGPLLTMTAGGFHIRDAMFIILNGKPAIQGVAVLTDGLLEDCWFNGGALRKSESLITGFMNNILFEGCNFEESSHAILLTGGASSYLTISGCVFYDMSNTILEFNNANGVILSDLFIESKTIEDPNASSVVFKDCRNINIANLIFSKVLDAPAESFLHAIHFENCDNVNISNVITDGFSSGAPFEIVNSTRINSAVMQAVI